MKIDSPNIIGGYSTWISLGIQPTYTSSTSITFTGVDFTPYFPTGTKIKFTQTTVKYFYVLSATYGTNTVLTLTGGSNYSVANAAITNFNYGHGVAYEFPEWFNWTPTIVGFSSVPDSGIYKFNLVGKLVCLMIEQPNDGTSDATSFSISLPITASSSGRWVTPTQFRNNSATSVAAGFGQISPNGTVCNFYTGWSGAGWTASGGKRISNCTLVYGI